MRTLKLAILALTFASLNGFGQQSLPVFRSLKDSIEYTQVQNDLQTVKALLADTTHPQRDSLTQVNERLYADVARIMNTGILRFRTVYQSSPALTSYPDFMREADPKKIRTLSISGRNRQDLPDSVFLCTNLEELELVNWKLKKLPRRLGELKKLREVTLLNNQPSSPLRLPRNKSIKELNIRGDDGNGMLPTKYKRLRHLETLDVSRNRLGDFPNVHGCQNLTRVFALFNEITLEELHGRQPRSVTDINLSNNKVKAVPASIGRFTNVKKLNFNNNQIEQVSEGIESLKQLEELSFYKNRLTSIPEAVYKLPNLKVIDLYYNDIEKADPRLGQMNNLEILYLANNRIYTLPDNLGQLRHLRELYLHHNRISNLPSSMRDLTDLTVLRINNNSILEFPPFLSELGKLQNLDISHNQITSLAVNDLPFKQLRILSLVGNPWDDETMQALPIWANQLRTNYKTVVHLYTYEDEGK